jgi:hypothetical protein
MSVCGASFIQEYRGSARLNAESACISEAGSLICWRTKMSLNVVLINDSVRVFDENITRSLNRMTEEAGLYNVIWHPDEINASVASDLVDALVSGLRDLKTDRDRFSGLSNYGTVEDLTRFVESYLVACLIWPDAKISVYR